MAREGAVVVMPHDVRRSSVRAAFGSSPQRKNAVLDTGAQFSQGLLAACLQHPTVLVLRKNGGPTEYGYRRIAAQQLCSGAQHLGHPPQLVVLLGFCKGRVEDAAGGVRAPRLDHHVRQQVQPVRHASVLARRPKLVDALLDANDAGLTAQHPAVDHHPHWP